MTTVLEKLRIDLLAGRTVRVIDQPRDQRPAAIAALAVLRDELPVRMFWSTYSESHVCETRLKCKAYRVPGELLHELLEATLCK